MICSGGTQPRRAMAAPKNPVIPPPPCYAAGELVLKPFFDITVIDNDLLDPSWVRPLHGIVTAGAPVEYHKARRFECKTP